MLTLLYDQLHEIVSPRTAFARRGTQPMSVTTASRPWPRVRCSRREIPCHEPSSKRPSPTGIVTDASAGTLIGHDQFLSFLAMNVLGIMRFQILQNRFKQEATMAWLDLVMTLCLIQLVAFSMLVGRARIRYGIKAPAVSGHETFERLFRVQMNTLELLVVLIPAMWLAAKYWAPHWIAVVGLIYMIGRMIYLRAYVREPDSRTVGFAMSMLPILGLLLSILVGIARGG